MPAYTGPVPPTPTASSTDAAWHNWWAYQTALQNLRFEDERAASVKLAAERVLITDKQQADKLASEVACAAGQQALAAAMRYAADRSREPDLVTPWTDEQLVRQFMANMVDTVPQGTAAMARAQAYLALLRFNFQPPAADKPEAPDA